MVFKYGREYAQPYKIGESLSDHVDAILSVSSSACVDLDFAIQGERVAERFHHAVVDASETTIGIISVKFFACFH
jgi:hypothetical protein